MSWGRLEDCERRCVACGAVWCIDEEVSPGEADGICLSCWLTESDEVSAS